MTLAVRFIRHGESLSNVGGVTSDVRTVPLTKVGRAQALALRDGFSTPPDLIVVSPYLRAQDTAAPTIQRFPSVPFETWPVHEFDYLDAQRCLNMNLEQRRPMSAAYWANADPLHIDGEGAESFSGLINRVRATLDRLSRLAAENIAMFSHGTFMKAVYWEIENGGFPICPETMRGFHALHLAAPIANAEGFNAYWDGEKWRVED